MRQVRLKLPKTLKIRKIINLRLKTNYYSRGKLEGLSELFISAKNP